MPSVKPRFYVTGKSEKHWTSTSSTAEKRLRIDYYWFWFRIYNEGDRNFFNQSPNNSKAKQWKNILLLYIILLFLALDSKRSALVFTCKKYQNNNQLNTVSYHHRHHHHYYQNRTQTWFFVRIVKQLLICILFKVTIHVITLTMHMQEH